jgi:hypothetical protein
VADLMQRACRLSRIPFSFELHLPELIVVLANTS